MIGELNTSNLTTWENYSLTSLMNFVKEKASKVNTLLYTHSQTKWNC